MRGPLVLTLAFALIAASVVAAVQSSPASSAPSSQQGQDPRYFAETGFRIDNDAFYSYFQRRGGVSTFGFPVSRSFRLEGFEVQIFQRRVMQLAPDGAVRLLNLLDSGVMPATSINFSRFPPPDQSLIASTPAVGQPDYGTRIAQFIQSNVPDQFEGMDVGFLRTFQNTVTLADAFPTGGGNPDLLLLLNLEMWGAPTSRPAYDPNNRGFVYQRFQRGIMHFDAATGVTEGLLLGDWFKSIITGDGLPADLEREMAGSRFLRQYNNANPNGLNRPSELPDTDMRNAFEPSQMAQAREFNPRVEVVAEGLNTPWAMAFAPDGRLFVTERPGRIRVIVDGQLLPTPVATLPAATTSESGLMGLALDPDFQSNGHLYVMYTYRSGGGLLNRISRLTVEGNSAGQEIVLLDGIPGASTHDGGRLAFGPDGKLYATTGDAGEGSAAQDLSSLPGKVLRLNPDGSIPADNPFPGSPVFSFGHRNPQGLAFQPGTGRLYATEHGPSGDDEVNLIEPGANYGWPVAQGVSGDARFRSALADYSPSIAPTGATFYSGERLFAWTGSLFFTTLRGQHLHRIEFGSDGRTVAEEERLYEGEYGRLRDVIQGPDGLLYFSTSNRDGRGSPASNDDRILRITID